MKKGLRVLLAAGVFSMVSAYAEDPVPAQDQAAASPALPTYYGQNCRTVFDLVAGNSTEAGAKLTSDILQKFKYGAVNNPSGGSFSPAAPLSAVDRQGDPLMFVGSQFGVKNPYQLADAVRRDRELDSARVWYLESLIGKLMIDNNDGTDVLLLEPVIQSYYALKQGNGFGNAARLTLARYLEKNTEALLKLTSATTRLNLMYAAILGDIERVDPDKQVPTPPFSMGSNIRYFFKNLFNRQAREEAKLEGDSRLISKDRRIAIRQILDIAIENKKVIPESVFLEIRKWIGDSASVSFQTFHQVNREFLDARANHGATSSAARAFRVMIAKSQVANEYGDTYWSLSPENDRSSPLDRMDQYFRDVLMDALTDNFIRNGFVLKTYDGNSDIKLPEGYAPDVAGAKKFLNWLQDENPKRMDLVLKQLIKSLDNQEYNASFLVMVQEKARLMRQGTTNKVAKLTIEAIDSALNTTDPKQFKQVTNNLPLSQLGDPNVKTQPSLFGKVFKNVLDKLNLGDDPVSLIPRPTIVPIPFSTLAFLADTAENSGDQPAKLRWAPAFFAPYSRPITPVAMEAFPTIYDQTGGGLDPFYNPYSPPIMPKVEVGNTTPGTVNQQTIEAQQAAAAQSRAQFRNDIIELASIKLLMNSSQANSPSTRGPGNGTGTLGDAVNSPYADKKQRAQDVREAQAFSVLQMSTRELDYRAAELEEKMTEDANLAWLGLPQPRVALVTDRPAKIRFVPDPVVVPPAPNPNPDPFPTQTGTFNNQPPIQTEAEVDHVGLDKIQRGHFEVEYLPAQARTPNDSVKRKLLGEVISAASEIYLPLVDNLMAHGVPEASAKKTVASVLRGKTALLKLLNSELNNSAGLIELADYAFNMDFESGIQERDLGVSDRLGQSAGLRQGSQQRAYFLTAIKAAGIALTLYTTYLASHSPEVIHFWNQHILGR